VIIEGLSRVERFLVELFRRVPRTTWSVRSGQLDHEGIRSASFGGLDRSGTDADKRGRPRPTGDIGFSRTVDSDPMALAATAFATPERRIDD
jgi:hypothetical protein